MSEERTLILKLGQMITDRIGHKVTVDDPEYWGLAEVLTDEMAEVCLAMKVRKPMTLEQIAKKSGKDKARVQQLLDEMSVIGMIEYNWENADRHKQYVLPMFVPGCAEFMMMNKKQTEEHPVIAEFFENMSFRWRRRSRRSSSLRVWSTFPTGSGNTRTNTRWAPAPAAASSGCAARDAARSKGICASASGIWRIILWRQGKAAISIWMK